MIISKSFEQALFVVLILASQKNHEPLKSTLLSQILRVSDSSLKKVLRKLVVAGLVFSEASKDGGFTLAKPLEQISLKDVILAVEGVPLVSYKTSGLAHKIFTGEDHITQSEQKISSAINAAETAFAAQLATLKLDALLEAGAAGGVVEWRTGGIK